jgi:Ca-activated chloride channel family protein
MRQIIMITDGKPSTLFIDEGQADSSTRIRWDSIRRSSMRRSRRSRQLPEVGNHRQRIHLTDDYYLVDFVKRMTEIARGRAYFTTSLSLAEYVMIDFVKGRPVA